jgi:putative transposase
MLLTKKYKIQVSDEQKDVLWNISEQCRLVYNNALFERKSAWENENRSVKYIEQQNNLPELKKQFSNLNIVYSKTLQGVLKKLDANYKSFFGLWKNGNKDLRPPKFKGKKYFFTIPYNQSGFKFSGNVITFSHKYNDVKLSFEIPDDLQEMKIKQWEIYNTVPYKALGDFYLSCIIETPITKEYVDNNKYQAIDMGISKTVTAINSDCKFFESINPRPDNYWNQKIDAIKSRRDHCKKGSTRWKRLHMSYRKMQRKSNNQIKDYQHKLSKTMIENTRANTIIVGDLNVKNMGKSKIKTLNRSTQNNGYLSRFIEFLTYKAEFAGKKVIKIDESYTSKTCYSCGKQHTMPLYQREMICDCGNNIDRDRNSAINIMFRYLSQNAIWTGYQEFLDNLQTELQLVVTCKNLHA